jgi:hypothetical protein
MAKHYDMPPAPEIKKQIKKKYSLSIEKCKKDPVYFAVKILKFYPTVIQKKILQDKSNRILIAAGRRWGKTMLMAVYTIWFVYTHANVTAACFAPSWEQSKIFMDEIRKHIEKPPLNQSIRISKKFDIELTNGSRILARTASRTAKGIRGRGVDLLDVEEAAFIPDELMAAIRPTRLDKKAKEFQVSTPLGHNHFWKSFQAKDVYSIYHLKTQDNPFISKKELKQEKKLMSSIEFKQEYEAEFIDDKFSVFNQKLIDLAIEPSLKFISQGEPDHVYQMGVDLGRKQDASVVMIVEKVNNVLIIRHIKEFINDGSTKFWTKVLDHIEYLCKAFNVANVCIDQSGVGDKPTLDLQNQFADNNIPTRVQGIVFTYGTKNSWEGLVNTLLIQFERELIKSPFNEKLIRQLKNIRFEISQAGNRRFVSVGSSPDFVMALALAIKAVPSFDYSVTGKVTETKKESEPGFKCTSEGFELPRETFI